VQRIQETSAAEAGEKEPELDLDMPGRRHPRASLEQRSAARRARAAVNRASSHADAEAWDLEFWQRQTPEARLSALVAIRRDIELIEAGRTHPAPEDE
jgi:hypothetical protein